MSYLIIEKKDNGVWSCCLNRVDKLNALSLDFISEATQFFKTAKAAADQGVLRTLILSSASEKAFCVGADLKERKGMNDDEVVATLDKLKDLTCALENISAPTIAVIEGAAFGGGLELALCCDIRIVSPKAVMGLTETRLAIIPGAGGTQRLTKLVGPAKAKELIFRGLRFDGKQAALLGVANHCVDKAEEFATNLADEIVQGGPLALRAAKEAVDGGAHLATPEGLQVERKAYLKTLKSQDRMEGLRAFEEKREAKYEGK